MRFHETAGGACYGNPTADARALAQQARPEVDPMVWTGRTSPFFVASGAIVQPRGTGSPACFELIDCKIAQTFSAATGIPVVSQVFLDWPDLSAHHCLWMFAGVFHHRHRVTYAECTAGNHVYYSRYLDILEAVRGEFFRSLGKPLLAWQENDTLFPVIECRLRYRSPARYDDYLSIRVWLTRLEGVRLAFGYDIRNETGKLILEAEVTHVCTTLQEKPKRLPVELKEMLAAFLKPVHP